MRSFFNLVSLTVVAAAGYVVPGPSGPYAVSLSNMTLTDNSRIDPYAPTQQKRRILISAYLPVALDRKSCPPRSVPYMPPAVAAHYGEVAAQIGLPNDTFAQFSMDFCDLTKFCANRKGTRGNFPLVLYDTGLGTVRELYGVKARELASQGYIVVTIDHPYDADVVEFPDGTVVEAANVDWDSEAEIVKALKVRGQDLSFLLAQLQTRSIRDALLAHYPSAIDFSRTMAIGHSLGGVAAGLVASTDRIVRGALNMDGGLHEPVQSTTFTKPFLQFGRAGHESTDPSWDQFWPRLHGQAAEFALVNATHGTFTDILTMTSALDLPAPVKQAIQEEYGTIDPVVGLKSIVGGVSAWLEFVFSGKKELVVDIHKHIDSLTLTRSNHL